MNINLTPTDTIKFLKNPESWSKFLTFYYFINDSIELRTINGSEKIDFKSSLKENILKIYMKTERKSLSYCFTINPVEDDKTKTSLQLDTYYKIPYLQNKTLQLMGMNIALNKTAILDNLSHFVDFGHIH
jgi:hypothetical protein